ncbi:hypothetical protein C8A00DRAFT_40373 [Chaetomidium leptoderma]|uniref:Uncharacterized protein n=1 Tax=Chaetomidium leptoderma TaxID=669021 RepID=A0AAN6VT22_9PEZI|nr:hypothetical protein C8A00DRAFT_40373 [Chaetomidium leptoderma]
MHFTTPSPPHRPVMETITALGDTTASTSCSQGTDIAMLDADWINPSGDEMLPDTPCRPSIESDHDTSLRGGVIYRPPNLAWRQKGVVASREDEEVEIDYEDLEGLSEDDNSSISSDWDNYGSLPLTMGEYDETVAHLEGSGDWNADQKKLHKLIFMRGLHPMMPSWWRVSFRMWGVTQPHLDDLFTPKHSKKRVAIHAYGNEVAAAKALESLFYLSQTVTDYEEIGYQSKIAPTVVKGIRSYIKWAMRDARIDTHNTQLNMLVQAYPPEFQDDGYVSDGSNFAPSPVSSNEDQEWGAADGSKIMDGANEADVEAAEAQRARRFTRAVSRDLERRLVDMGQRWRNSLRNKRGKGFIAEPPTLYAFAVIQHIVLLASHDSSSPTNPVVVLEQIVLNDRGQWLWNALSIALPVNMARDALNGMWDAGVVVAEHDDSEADPDL